MASEQRLFRPEMKLESEDNVITMLGYCKDDEAVIIKRFNAGRIKTYSEALQQRKGSETLPIPYVSCK